MVGKAEWWEAGGAELDCVVGLAPLPCPAPAAALPFGGNEGLPCTSSLCGLHPLWAHGLRADTLTYSLGWRVYQESCRWGPPGSWLWGSSPVPLPPPCGVSACSQGWGPGTGQLQPPFPPGGVWLAEDLGWGRRDLWEEVGSRRKTLGQPREQLPVPFLRGHFQSWGCTCKAPSLGGLVSGKGWLPLLVVEKQMNFIAGLVKCSLFFGWT